MKEPHDKRCLSMWHSMTRRRIATTLCSCLLLAACAGESAPERTVLTPGEGWYTSPTYSPDGAHMAYLARIDGDFSYWVADTDGSSPVREDSSIYFRLRPFPLTPRLLS